MEYYTPIGLKIIVYCIHQNKNGWKIVKCKLYKLQEYKINEKTIQFSGLIYQRGDISLK